MNPNDVAPMVASVTLILVTGGVILLRPLVKRLGDFLEQATLEKRRTGSTDLVQQTERMVQLVESVETRLGRLEERVNFTEAVLLSKGASASALTVERDR